MGIEAGRSSIAIVGNELAEFTSHGIALSSVGGFVVANNLLRNTVTLNPGSVRGATIVVGGGSNEPSTVGVIDANVIIEDRRIRIRWALRWTGAPRRRPTVVSGSLTT